MSAAVSFEILKCEYWVVFSYCAVDNAVQGGSNFVDEILKCDYSSKSYWEVHFCGTIYYAVQDGANFWVCGRNPKS